MIRRLAHVTLLAVILSATYGIVRVLGVDARSVVAMLLFGVLAGMPSALLVLFVAGRSTQDGAK